jgi:hypothetical protein
MEIERQLTMQLFFIDLTFVFTSSTTKTGRHDIAASGIKTPKIKSKSK